MESIFGEPPLPSNPHGELLPSTSAIDKSTPQHLVLSSSEELKQAFSHVDNGGKARMVDVSSKENSKRSAVASCRVLLGKHAFSLVAANQIAKGDVLNVAKIAGIQGAKQTSNLIPLCHSICLTHVDVDLVLNEKDLSVEIVGEATTMSRTGVEMEVMTAVAVAGLTVYDMCKAVTKGIQITDVCLEKKNGGKSGSWSRKMPNILFTGLEDYKARGTQASPYFTVTHYNDFAESKGIVLIRGEVVLPSKLDDSEARWLLETAHTFYLNDVKYRLVERFNKETHEFEFSDVLRALEMPVL